MTTTMLDFEPLDDRDAYYDSLYPGACEAMPFGDEPNYNYDHGKYPTVIYNFQGRPIINSCTLFGIAIRYAHDIQRLATDNDVSLIWTDRYWNIS